MIFIQLSINVIICPLRRVCPIFRKTFASVKFMEIRRLARDCIFYSLLVQSTPIQTVGPQFSPTWMMKDCSRLLNLIVWRDKCYGFLFEMHRWGYLAKDRWFLRRIKHFTRMTIQYKRSFRQLDGNDMKQLFIIDDATSKWTFRGQRWEKYMHSYG